MWLHGCVAVWLICWLWCVCVCLDVWADVCLGVWLCCVLGCSVVELLRVSVCGHVWRRLCVCGCVCLAGRPLGWWVFVRVDACARVKVACAWLC